MAQSRMTMAQADILQYYLENCEAVEEVKVHDRTCDAIITGWRFRRISQRHQAES